MKKIRNPEVHPPRSVTPVCQRSFLCCEDVTEEDIKAEFKHGILKLFVPKKEAKPAVEQTDNMFYLKIKN